MHRAHDYRHLIQRWRALCRANGLRLQRCGRAGKYDIHYLRTRAAPGEPGVYVSAGIHGDEPAGPSALLLWAEANLARMRDRPLLLFPCLNPWGLVNNSRLDEHGRDLNRTFQLDELPLIAGWKKALGGQQFTIALALHEDYDGEGLYLYEVQRRPPGWGKALLAAARPHLPVEARTRIDAFAAKAGIIRRRLRLARFETIGYPEAIWLHLHHAERTFTVEAPSEFAFERRTRALMAVIDAAMQRAFAERRLDRKPKPRQS